MPVKPNYLKVIKPWGYEIILTSENSSYTGKILHVESGKQSSLQYHDQKIETLTLIKGEAILLIGENVNKLEEIKMESEKGYDIMPKVIHRYRAVTDCDIVEHSTPEIGNTFRIEDDYNRETETEEKRKLRLADKLYTG